MALSLLKPWCPDNRKYDALLGVDVRNVGCTSAAMELFAGNNRYIHIYRGRVFFTCSIHDNCAAVLA